MHNHWWFLDLKWNAWVFVLLMIIAIIVLLWTRESFTWNSRSDDVATRRFYYPSALGALFFTAVLYLGVHWEMWGWYRLFILFAWWIGLIAALLNLVIHKMAGLAIVSANLAFALVVLMLVISFISWVVGLFHNGGIHLFFPWWVWVLIGLLILVGLGMLARVSVIAALAVLAVLALVGSLLWLNNDLGVTPSHTDNGVSKSNAAKKKAADEAEKKKEETQKKAEEEAQKKVTVPVQLYEETTPRSVALAKKYGVKVVTVKVDGKNTETPVFVYGSMTSVGNGGRLWSDAVNKPLATRTLEGEQAVVVTDPAQAAMVMNGMGPRKVGDKTVAQLNPWMKAQGSPGAISKWAQTCLTNDVTVHMECAKTMSLTAELLGRLQDKGVIVADSVWNYHLTGGGLTVGSVPTFGLNPVQEHQGHFLELSLTEKTGGCWLRFGFNVGRASVNGGDNRMAGLTCKAPTQKSQPSSKRTNTKPGTSRTTKTPPTTTTTTRPHNQCVPSKMPYKPGYKVDKYCHYYKPAQSRNCMLNNVGCAVPNHAVQPVQDNKGQPTGGTSGAPTSAPTPAPGQSSQTPDPTNTPGETIPGTNTGTPTATPTQQCGPLTDPYVPC